MKTGPYGVIHIPDFSLQAVLRHDSTREAAALVEDKLPKAKIRCANDAARAAGVREGMTSTQAMSRCAGILFKTRSELQEIAARDALHQCAYAFSPSIEATSEGICTLDLSGMSRRGVRSGTLDVEEKNLLAHAIIEQLASLHLPAQVGIAGTPLMALHAARAARPVRIVDDPTTFLPALPLEYACSLNASREREFQGVLEILRKWGIHTFGAFIALGADGIAKRLGPIGLELFECASATAIRPLKLIVPRETFEESIEFENEIETLEPLLFSLRRFIEQICLRLEMVYLSARELRLRLRFSAGDDYERIFRIPAPTRNVDVLCRMLHTHLESFKAEWPIIALELSALACRPTGHQLGLFETALNDPNQFYETLARLSALLGPDRVGTPVVEQTYRPDAFRMETVCFEDSSVGASPVASRGRGLALRRFRPPLAASIILRGGRPAAISTLQFSVAVAEARGPWRSSGNWWDASRWERDEWDVQTPTGEIYRLSQHTEGWFVEGEMS